MTIKTKKIIKTAAVAVGGVILVGGMVIGVTGLWPVARVGVSPITYAAFRDNFMMADHFYRSNIKIGGKSDQVVNTKEVQHDLQRVTMEGLINRILIDRELARRYNAGDLERLIANKVAGVDLTSEGMVKAMDLMYGLTPGEFRELVLIPKAKQEILEGNLSLRNGSFDEWLTAQKTAAHVSIFVPGLWWNGSGVQVR